MRKLLAAWWPTLAAVLCLGAIGGMLVLSRQREEAMLEAECACAEDVRCSVRRTGEGTFERMTEWEAAPLGVVLQPGTFGGQGCVRRPCASLKAAWPLECPRP